jgi:ParB family transcriptional regulator, chromosome partitioning protein
MHIIFTERRNNMGSNSKLAYGSDGRAEILLFAPEQLVLVTDKSSPLYDERVELQVDPALVTSILEHGVLESIVVRKNGEREDGTPIVEVVDGRQRVRAAMEANRLLVEAGKPGTIRVPAVPKRADDKKTIAMMVATNEIRRDDPPVTKARKAQRMIDRGCTMDEVCRAFGCSDQTINLWLKLLETDDSVQKAVEEGELPYTVAARELSKMPRAEQAAALSEMRKNGTTKGRKAEKAARAARNGKSAAAVTTDGERVRSRKRLEAVLSVAENEEDEDKISHAIACTLRWVLGQSIRGIQYNESFPDWTVSVMADQEE